MITLNSWPSALEEAPMLRDGCIVAAGNFDGAHRGHQKLIHTTVSRARATGRPALALTFSPHPRVYFGAISPELLLFTPSQKSRALSQMGIDIHLNQTFNSSFAHQTAPEFITQVLHKGLRCQEIFVGSDFRFGKGRSGHADELGRITKKLGIKAHVIDKVRSDHEDQIYSSSQVRTLMSEGRMQELWHHLARPLLFEETVRSGAGLGSRWGYPTANLPVPPLYPLKNGVYSALVSLGPSSQRPLYLPPPMDLLPPLNSDHRPHGLIKAVINKGIRPTILAHRSEAEVPTTRPAPPGSDSPSHPPDHIMEVHLLDLDTQPPQPGKNIGVYLMEYLRNEKVFPSIASLTEQISRDIQSARSSFEHLPIPNGGTWLP